MFVDTHAHLDFKHFRKDLHGTLDNARRAGMVACITIGIDVKTSKKALDLATEIDDVFATVGIHPHEADSATEEALDRLEEIARSSEKVVAVGECGLDYVRGETSRDDQDAAFRKQMDLAGKLGLPVVIHSRESYDDVLRILESYNETVTGVIHCMSGDAAFRDAALALGYYIAVGGPLTYPDNNALREVMAGVPRDRLLVETDAPFLTPLKRKPGRNEPAFIADVLPTFAELFRTDVEEIGKLTTANAKQFFRLPIRVDT